MNKFACKLHGYIVYLGPSRRGGLFKVCTGFVFLLLSRIQNSDFRQFKILIFHSACVLHNVLYKLRNVLGVLRNVPGVLCNVTDVLRNVLGVLRNVIDVL